MGKITSRVTSVMIDRVAFFDLLQIPRWGQDRLCQQWPSEHENASHFWVPQLEASCGEGQGAIFLWRHRRSHRNGKPPPLIRSSYTHFSSSPIFNIKKDGKIYLLDFARLFPPEATSVTKPFFPIKDTRAVFYKMLRPELVARNPYDGCTLHNIILIDKPALTFSLLYL